MLVSFLVVVTITTVGTINISLRFIFVSICDVREGRRQSISSLESMKKEQEEEILKKQVHHEDILIELYRKHYEEEKQLRFVHANQRYELEQLLMEKVHSKQLKALDKQQKKEEGDLRKMMEKHNLDQRRNISSANGDHHEIQRVRDEAKKKHIGQTVQFTKELRMRHVDKKDELQKKMIELQELLSTDCDKVNSYFWFAVKCCVVVVKYFHLSTSKYLRL
ncbi:putative 1-phosphatidylinositol 4,5-bisphosphate phosphodiesterase beta-3 isoform X3 [Apostichopus japonicus]|uniref:Putative 1-phosphatidylinositol 4,5-bisphosphate phosphodiesterase beta-3 isoform X3 n=1 Tax=Stichopus japonicus TaxID=307972 RepID=A0A2G8JE21_STIJA|nr:putative 1-phosphatidylinositol 4,5-bisphosphate phosphodiesterase beta-3 isoform X3 [Apostichopus japonicus]